MKVDRRLIGVLLISLIAGSLLSLYLIGERIETPINLIDDSHPTKALAGTSNLDLDKYGVAFICREDLNEVAVRFSYLMQTNLTLIEEGPAASLEKAGEHVEEVKEKLVLLQEAGYEPDIFTESVQVGGRTGTLVVYDFGSKLNRMLPEGGASHFPTVYAILLDKSKNLDAFFEGVSDFFFKREISLRSLEITVNANKSIYMAAEDEAEVREEVEPLSSAPAQGTIIFSDLKRNDRVSIFYRIFSRYGDYPRVFVKRLSGKYMIHMVRFEVNGEPADDKLLLHLIENGVYREA